MASKQHGQNIVVRRLSDRKIEEEYSDLLRDSLRGLESGKIAESDLKKLMFKNLNNPRIPPLNLHLKGLKTGFMEYVNLLISKSE